MAHTHHHGTGDQNEHHEAGSTGKVLDPVCRMSVTPEHAADSVEYHGRTCHCCSTGCAERFRKEPTKSLKDEDEQETSGRHHHDEGPGDTIVLLTDGLIETMSTESNPLGRKSIIATMGTNQGAVPQPESPHDLVARWLRLVIRHGGILPPFDPEQARCRWR